MSGSAKMWQLLRTGEAVGVEVAELLDAREHGGRPRTAACSPSSSRGSFDLVPVQRGRDPGRLRRSERVRGRRSSCVGRSDSSRRTPSPGGPRVRMVSGDPVGVARGRACRPTRVRTPWSVVGVDAGTDTDREVEALAARCLDHGNEPERRRAASRSVEGDRRARRHRWSARAGIEVEHHRGRVVRGRPWPGLGCGARAPRGWRPTPARPGRRRRTRDRPSRRRGAPCAPRSGGARAALLEERGSRRPRRGSAPTSPAGPGDGGGAPARSGRNSRRRRLW